MESKVSESEHSLYFNQESSDGAELMWIIPVNPNILNFSNKTELFSHLEFLNILFKLQCRDTRLLHSFDKILFSKKKKIKSIKTCANSWWSHCYHRTCAGSLVTVILQFKDTAGFVATLLINASLPYQLGMIFKCKVGHLSFLGRFWRKETWKNTTIGKILTLV